MSARDDYPRLSWMAQWDAQDGVQCLRALDEIDRLRFEVAGLNDKLIGALSAALDGVYDGAHHKMWVIDQMVRCLADDAYEAWRPYDWDEGTPP